MPIGKIERKPIEAKVEVEEKSSGKVVDRKEEVKPIGHVDSSVPMHNVGFSVKRTKNLGDYNSISISVSLNIPCIEDDVNEAMDQAQEWVMHNMDEVFENLGLTKKK